MDIGRAFTFFLNDPEWIQKVLIGALISLIPLVGGFIILGWALGVTRNVYRGTDTPLPDWSDIGGYLIRGVIAWVGALLWALPVVILTICVAVGIVASQDSNAALALVIFAGLGAFFLAIVYLAVFLPVPVARYAVREDFSSMFQFDQILAEVRRGIRPLLVALVVWLIAAMIVAPLGLIACFVGVYVTTVMSYLMIAHAMGQAYREIDRPEMTTDRPAF